MIVKITATEHVHYSAEREISEEGLENLKHHAKLNGMSPDDLGLDSHHATSSEMNTFDTDICVSHDGGKTWESVV